MGQLWDNSTFFHYSSPQFYPDEGHQLLGVRSHLFNSVSVFLRECFRIPEEGGSATVAAADEADGDGDGEVIE